MTTENSRGQNNELQLTVTRQRAMKRIFILMAVSLLLLSTANAQGGGGESTKPKPSPKKTSGTKPTTTSSRPPAPPARPRSPTVASLMVNSNFPNATVTINGRTAGATDSNGHLVMGSMKPGDYTVSVTKPGFQPDKMVVTLARGQSETLNFELKPITQSLTISSTPPESAIYIDEILRGSTDASGNARVDVPVGAHRVAIRKARYREAVFPLSLSSDKEGQINANLELAIGFLTVTTNAPNPSINISGLGNFDKPVSKVECQPGTYTVTISSPLYVTSRKEVSVSAGQEAQLSMDLEADSAARSRLASEALGAYSRKQYDRAINVAKTLVAVDAEHSQALTVLAESYFMRDDFASFIKFGSQAIDAGGSVEVSLKHHHEFFVTTNMHAVRLVIDAQSVTYDPQVTQLPAGSICPNPPFKVSLAILGGAEVSGNRQNEIYVRLTFVDPNKPKKSNSLRFGDRESYFVKEMKNKGPIRYQGETMVSRRQALGAMTAIAELLNRAKTKTNRLAGASDSSVPATKAAATRTIDDIYGLGASPDSRVPKAPTVTSPDPELAFAGRESFQSGGRIWTRYKLTVTNRNAYSQDMFASAPDLPPCGLNTKASRTWVDVYDQQGKRLQSFCAFLKPGDLSLLWFAVPEGQAPPSEAFVVLSDRLSKKEYKSNLAAIP